MLLALQYEFEKMGEAQLADLLARASPQGR